MTTSLLKKYFAALIFLLTMLSLAGCNGLFNKDNAPKPSALLPIKHDAVQTDTRWVSGYRTYLHTTTLALTPKQYDRMLYMTSDSGHLLAINQDTGAVAWSYQDAQSFTSGPGVNADFVAAGTSRGAVIILNRLTGKPMFRVAVEGEVIATPLLTNRYLIIKTTNGTLYTFDLKQQTRLWVKTADEPQLILNASSTPLLQQGALYTGFANGYLEKIDLQDGRTDWRRLVAMPEGAFTINRMVDIDANPIPHGTQIIAATYQGKIASFESEHGEMVWSHALSSYTGMTSDDKAVYISEADGTIAAFDGADGTLLWEQKNLAARDLTAPVLWKSYLIVGDKEGYLHWLHKTNGALSHRAFIGNTILAAPLVSDNTLYALTNRGVLVALQMRAKE